MNDTFEFTLNNPLSEEQWDMIADVDMERTDSVTFHTKHGKEVEFAKVRHGKWLYIRTDDDENGVYECSVCRAGEVHSKIVNVRYCWNCGARMDGAERKEE